MKPRVQASSMMAASRAVVASLQRGSVSRALWYRLDAPGHLERQHGRNDQVAIAEFVDDHLVDRDATGAAGDETIERWKEAGTGSPLCLVELAQDLESAEDGGAPDRPMLHSFGLQTVGGLTEIPAELLGQGRPECLWAVRQLRERGRGHGLTPHPARQGFD